ncbi:diguanylate cyclase/phosphodiesterase (GGDEF & EAL domains) with PAS/PAC sensor(s) [Methylomonas albis]|uniref:EAL domain-containing protein n=1 Tax=Methylomonas albis TaxID=1854563 RepID=A0ABR9CVQ4_9GAMM|nr:EAL domain-containing protein [Methylomonas albis]MBD9354927.1 EAL domain-containing protein [Methylomonas albis]CAD6877850.1 diguanylate cyclase/phosphodiesterase (GGDEF & EAL domains) with PAS/PAC sensor(s) [Methylomonas albis]
MRSSIGIKLGFWLALLGTLSTGLTGYYVYDRSRVMLVKTAKEKLLNDTQGLGHRFADALADTASNVKLLANLPVSADIASAGPSADLPTRKIQLAEIFVSLLNAHPEYSQIRLIDTQHYGKELVRVDRDQDKPKVIAEAQLQEKNHFPYVFETVPLPAEQYYVSEINLNQELGTHMGFGKPTLRVAMPIKSANLTIAVTVINVDLDGLFEQVRSNIPDDIKLLLSNDRGDYLIHPDGAKTFGFESGRSFLIQDDIPDIKTILAGKQEHSVFATSDTQSLAASSLAAFVKLPLGSASSGRFVLLGLYTPLQNVLVESKALGMGVIEITLLFSLLASVISLILARVLAKPLNSMTSAIGQFKLGTPLTGLPTHRNDEIGYLANSFMSMTDQLNSQVAELHASEAKLHAILDNAPVGIWLADLNRRFLFVNHTFCDALGLPEARFIANEQLAELFGAETAARFLSADQECLAQANQPHQSLEHIKFTDGKRHTIQITRTQLQDINKDTVGIIGIAMDISDRQQAANRERAHNHVLELLSKGSALPEILQAVVWGVETQNPDLLCSILLLNSEGNRLFIGAAPRLPDFYNAAVDGLYIGPGIGSCGTAAYFGQRVIVEDIQNHTYWGPFTELAAQAGLGACWSEPIRGASGQLLGTFAIYQRQPAAPGADDIQMIEQASHLAGIAIDRSRSNEELQLASLVYQNSSEAMAVTDAQGMILNVNPAFTDLTGYTLDEVIGKNHNILNSERQGEQFYQAMWQAINSSGHWKGEIWNRRKNGEIFAEQLTINTIFSADGLPQRRVALFSDITQKKQSEELIWNQANFDPLTGLPNRRMFHDRLDQEIKKAHRSGLQVALILLDLDRFKEINDTLGHDMGDLLLKDASQRLLRCVRDSDTVARLGGDEFTVILGELEDADNLERVVKNILQRLAEPFQLKTKVAYVSASIGITLYPKDAERIDALIKNADQAMYAAKHQGRNRYCYFTPSMQEAAQTRMLIAEDLRHALETDQFEVYYQPVVELGSGAIHKAEALIRWQHPTRGMVSPAEFVHIAEDIGLIAEIGDWVFKQAASQVKQWRSRYHPDFQISVNKSPVQFYEGHSRQTWLEHLQTLELPGESIVAEITEGLLLDASNVVKDQLLAFRDAGIQVSLDDFGTGYSSLAYLKKFDIDYLKIDQSFVGNLSPDSSDKILCEAIIVMAHKLGMKVIAEGIETEQQRQLLLDADCDYGQGYLFSRPLSANAFEELLIQQTSSANAPDKPI